jgi:hypothetical protein
MSSAFLRIQQKFTIAQRNRFTGFRRSSALGGI